LFTVLVTCFVPLIVYVVINKDFETATSAAGLVVSCLTLLWMIAGISKGMGE